VFIIVWIFSNSCYENRIFIAVKNHLNAGHINIFVNKLIGCYLKDQFSIPVSGRGFSLLRLVQTGDEAYPAPYSAGTGSSLPTGKVAGMSRWIPAGILFSLPTPDPP
jgi:hypothetical protein